jgi:hypothetical protein
MLDDSASYLIRAGLFFSGNLQPSLIIPLFFPFLCLRALTLPFFPSGYNLSLFLQGKEFHFNSGGSQRIELHTSPPWFSQNPKIPSGWETPS